MASKKSAKIKEDQTSPVVYNIQLGCLSNSDIHDFESKNVIVVEPFVENYSMITGVKKFNYYIHEKTGTKKLYYAAKISSELRLLSPDKMDLIRDLYDHDELTESKKILAIDSVTSYTYNTITLYDLLVVNEIKFNDIVNIYVSTDVDISKTLEDTRLNDYTLSVYDNNNNKQYTKHSRLVQFV